MIAAHSLSPFAIGLLVVVGLPACLCLMGLPGAILLERMRLARKRKISAMHQARENHHRTLDRRSREFHALIASRLPELGLDLARANNAIGSYWRLKPPFAIR